MAVPRNRHSDARRKSKRAHMAKTPKQAHSCSNCNARKLPHVVCSSCGFYAGRQVFNMSETAE